jgi:hypothetical protein
VVAVCKDDREDRIELAALREAMEALISTHASLEVSIRCSAREMRSVGVRAFFSLLFFVFLRGRRTFLRCGFS